MTDETSKLVPIAKRKPPSAGIGRKKGVPNKLTRTIKEAIEASFEKVGGQLEQRRRWAADSSADVSTIERQAAIKANMRDVEYCSAEAASQILDEFGLRREKTEARKQHLGPPRSPTTAELEEIRKELGW